VHRQQRPAPGFGFEQIQRGLGVGFQQYRVQKIAQGCCNRRLVFRRRLQEGAQRPVRPVQALLALRLQQDLCPAGVPFERRLRLFDHLQPGFEAHRLRLQFSLAFARAG